MTFLRALCDFAADVSVLQHFQVPFRESWTLMPPGGEFSNSQPEQLIVGMVVRIVFKSHCFELLFGYKYKGVKM